MKVFKYCCAILAVAYLVTAGLPTVDGAPKITPEWVGRSFSAMYWLIPGTMFLGMQSRRTVFWKLIPALMFMFLLINMIVPIWIMIQLKETWLPFLSILIFIVPGFVVFVAWWRNQKSYFYAHAH